jgi:hypothetical protein
MTAEAKLLDQLDGLIKHFNNQSDKHKQLHRRLRYCAIGLTGLATVLAGIAATFPEANRFFSVLLVLTTAAVSVVTAVEGVRKPGELWIHERNVLHTLRDLRRQLDLLHAAGERIDVMHYSNRLDELLNAAKQTWADSIVRKTGIGKTV